VQNTPFSINKTLNVRGELVSMETPLVMGILNVTPDSFFDGGRNTSDKNILRSVETMLHDGATFIDVGGYSTRPGASEVLPDEEVRRVVSALRVIVKEFPSARISVDTFRASTAIAAIENGACMINDVSGGELDSDMFVTVARLKVPYILMHMRGNPQTMTSQTSYQNLVKDILDYFHNKVSKLTLAGVKDIIIDPGFGFAKTREQNFEVLTRLPVFHQLGRPILAGLSRKSLIWKTLNISAEEALNGTTSLNTIALEKGASILRVHDVKEAKEVVDLFCAMKNIQPIKG
jgi:dihydropteroate synthase